MPEESLEKHRKIVEVTGGNERFKKIEEFSAKKAKEMNIPFDQTNENDYFKYIYSHNSNNHCNKE